jgi:ankyrin repeat protein
MNITLESLNDNNYDIEYKCISYITSKGFTKLMKLVMLIKEYPELQKEIEKVINENPEEINKQNNYGFTALTLAAINSNNLSNIETVKLLLNHTNIDVNIRDIDGWTTLMRVSKYSNTYSNIDTVKLLLDHPNIDVNIQDIDGWTALIITVDTIQSNIETVKLLLNHPKIDVNIKDVDGWTALMTASKYINVLSNIETLQLLLNNRNVDVSNYMNFLIRTEKIHLLNLIPSYKIERTLFGKYIYMYDLINEKITKQTFGYNMQNNTYSDIEICFNL